MRVSGSRASLAHHPYVRRRARALGKPERVVLALFEDLQDGGVRLTGSYSNEFVEELHDVFVKHGRDAAQAAQDEYVRRITQSPSRENRRRVEEHNREGARLERHGAGEADYADWKARGDRLLRSLSRTWRARQRELRVPAFRGHAARNRRQTRSTPRRRVQADAGGASGDDGPAGDSDGPPGPPAGADDAPAGGACSSTTRTRSTRHRTGVAS